MLATVCVGAGFMLATGWDMPQRVTAQHNPTGAASLAAMKYAKLNEVGESPFIAVAAMVKPTVVNIQAEKTLGSNPKVPFDMFDWGPFFGEPPNRKPGSRVPSVTSGGTGIIIGKDGLIMTNNHVIADANIITVKLSDGTESIAEIIGTDPDTDVAVIKINKTLPDEMIARIGDSDATQIGEWAIAIGSPFGLEQTVTVGVISARGRSNLNVGGRGGPSYQNFIQTDASINFGNSGGPLVNIHGKVIGVNTAINAQGQGIGFAIPINLAMKIANQLVNNGEVKRGYLGVYPRNLDELTREALGIDSDVTGVLIETVQPDTPAEEGGLKGGDIVTSIGDHKVSTMSDFRFKIADYPPDSQVKMEIVRKGKNKTLKFKLGDRSLYLNQQSSAPSQPELWLGIRVGPTDGPRGMRMGLGDSKGVLVLEVQSESSAEGLIEPGDVIVEIGGNEIRSVDDFMSASKELAERTKAIPFWIERQGRRMFIPIKPE